MAALPLTWAAVSGLSAANASTPSFSVTAITKVLNRPDSGNVGYWADDNFTRKAKITFGGAVAASHCGGTSPCFHWTGVVADAGTFVTLVGQTSPGVGDLNGNPAPKLGVKATGPMAGGILYSFYTNSKAASAKGVPAKEDDKNTLNGVPTHAWVTQFFAKGTKFWDSTGASNTYLNLNVGGWAYTLPFGADPKCPNLSTRWIDAAPNWGNSAVDGNILAPAAGHC